MLIEYLSTGKENAKTARELCTLLGYKNTRAVTQEIARLRCEGAVICSSCREGRHGYFLPADDSDVLAFSRQMHSRSTEILRAVAPADAHLQGARVTFTNLHLKCHYNVLLGIRTTKRDALNNCASLDENVAEDVTRGELLGDAAAMLPFEAVEEAVFIAELHDALEAGLDKLPVEQRAIVQARYYGGATWAQIGRDQCIADYTVRAQHSRGLHRLRQDKRLEAFHDEIKSPPDGYRHTGLATFKATRMTETERAAIFRIYEQLVE